MPARRPWAGLDRSRRGGSRRPGSLRVIRSACGPTPSMAPAPLRHRTSASRRWRRTGPDRARGALRPAGGRGRRAPRSGPDRRAQSLSRPRPGDHEQRTGRRRYRLALLEIQALEQGLAPSAWDGASSSVMAPLQVGVTRPSGGPYFAADKTARPRGPDSLASDSALGYRAPRGGAACADEGFRAGFLSHRQDRSSCCSYLLTEELRGLAKRLTADPNI